MYVKESGSVCLSVAVSVHARAPACIYVCEFAFVCLGFHSLARAHVRVCVSVCVRSHARVGVCICARACGHFQFKLF